MSVQKGDFADRIRTLAGERGITRYRLAKESGVSDTMVRNLFAGRCEPGYYTLVRLKEAFGCTWDDLMGD